MYFPANSEMKRKMSSNKEAETPAADASCESNQLAYQPLVLWRQPLKTLKYGCLELFDLLVGLGSRLLSRRFLFSFVIVTTLCVMPGPHSSYMQMCRRNLCFFLYWLGLGCLSSVGFGTGLHTFLLYMGPHIASVTLAAYECETLDLPVPPYPDQKICPNEPYAHYIPSALQILSKVRPEALFWSLGTVLGELPPYFMARAARIEAKCSTASTAEESKPTSPSSKSKALFDRSKALLEQAVLRSGFLGILLCASVPNPLFDMAGMVCGHFEVPFWKFFLATLIGKAIIKSNIQQLIVIIAFTKDQVNALIKALGCLPLVGTQMQLWVQNMMDSTKRQMHNKDTELATSDGTFSGFRLAAYLFQLLSYIFVAYFLTSLVQTLAQRRYKRNQLKQVRPPDTDTKIDEIVEKKP